MQGNGQAQTATLFKRTALAHNAPAGYYSPESIRKPVESYSLWSSPKAGTTAPYPQLSAHAMATERSLLPFSNALLLIQTDAHAAVDRRALREAGISSVRVLTSGVLAARLLVGLVPNDTSPAPQLIVCHEMLEDMSGADFVSLIRSHPQLLDIPILAVAGNDTAAQKVAALASGYSALLVRPYSSSTLRSTLFEAARNATDSQYLEQARQNICTGAFDQALAQYTALSTAQETPEFSFNEGMRLLQQRQWDPAIRAFQKAMRHITLKGESELGLATAWKGKGDIERYTYYLAEASNTFARATQWHRARSVYARLLAEDPEASSPFLRMAERLVRECRFEEAAEALAAGYELSPGDPVPPALAKACMCTDAPAYAAQRVEESLHQVGMSTVAPQLGEQIRKALVEEEEKILERQTKNAERTAAMEAENGHASATARLNRNAASTSMGGTLREDSTHKTPRKGISLNFEDGEYNVDSSSAVPPKAQKLLTLKPLTQEDAESTLFASMPGLNEALSVAKFTWKMFRAQK